MKSMNCFLFFFLFFYPVLIRSNNTNLDDDVRGMKENRDEENGWKQLEKSWEEYIKSQEKNRQKREDNMEKVQEKIGENWEENKNKSQEEGGSKNHSEDNPENQEINFEELGDYLEGDIYYPPPENGDEEKRDNFLKNGIESRAWPSGIVPVELAPGFSKEERAKVIEALNLYHRYTCVVFRWRNGKNRDLSGLKTGKNLESKNRNRREKSWKDPKENENNLYEEEQRGNNLEKSRNKRHISTSNTGINRQYSWNNPYEEETERDYVVVEKGNSGCWSSVGRIGGRQRMNLQIPGCTAKIGTILHEFLHVLGFEHEQNRGERDEYVEIKWDNVKEDKWSNFEKSRNSLNSFGVSYDYESVMHYSSRAFSKNGKNTIIPKQETKNMGQRDAFSSKDIQKINLMYKCDEESIRNNIINNLLIDNNHNNNNNNLINNLFPVINWFY